MGQGQSNFKIYCKINITMPRNDDISFKGWRSDKNKAAFASEQDHACITVISQNGAVDLRDHDFRLLYGRRDGGKEEHIIARLVAEKEGVIRAQITPQDDGKTQIEAFLALRRHVEIQLDRILSGIDGSSLHNDDKKKQDSEQQMAGSSRVDTQVTGSITGASTAGQTSPSSPRSARRGLTSDTRNASGPIALPADAPPAYGRAVKEWRSDEKTG